MTGFAQGIMLPRDIAAADVLRFASRVEELGFDELWVVEDLGFRGGIAQAASVLARTDRIRVGIGILPAAVRNVAFEAMEIATLAQLYPGRVDVGIGHGMPAWIASVGAWQARPLQLLEEHVRALRSLLNGERVTADGRVELHDVGLDASALPAVVPDILLGVRGPRSLAASGRIADGTVLAEPSTPEYVREALGRIASPTPHRIVAYNVAVVRDTDAEAWAAARPGLEWIGEPDWAPHLAPLAFATDLARLRAEAGSRAEFAARLPDEWVAQLSLAGSPATVIHRLRELHEAGVTSSVMIPVGPDPFAAVTALAQVLATAAESAHPATA
ncbi:luciferase [Subtercola boreus]|uniref:Luciferase n=1 Tax=Subtercola boreus TaxID=120213 RepID=A0A3E0VML6_9MICO|nr:LLM class flavin-dependent oxidoreductase [Subtercola boreus]RFA10698.1 luciferase [Subtercola boreus]TQL55740.1 alkanesulfonate monooxygenase SsuD/methylene tetrahydromethanopterin reductase-like flavin-dependent oxidoreductase (luciferase family) [Subtercola boreus]